MGNINLKNFKIIANVVKVQSLNDVGLCCRSLLKIILLVGFTLSFTNSIFAISPKENDQNYAQDSAKITIRKPLESRMTTLKKSKDYQYGVQESQVLDTWWKRFLRQIFNWFNNLFTGIGNPTFWKISAYVFIASVVVYVTLKLMGVDFSGLYRKKNNNEIPYETLGENIHAIDFTESIAEAIIQRNYRLAVRLYYLKVLKELTDHKMINWQINKTNRSYVYELNSPTLRADFEQITIQFEYAWYGDFPVDEAEFTSIKNQFLTFSNSIFANG